MLQSVPAPVIRVVPKSVVRAVPWRLQHPPRRFTILRSLYCPPICHLNTGFSMAAFILLTCEVSLRNSPAQHFTRKSAFLSPAPTTPSHDASDARFQAGCWSPAAPAAHGEELQAGVCGSTAGCSVSCERPCICLSTLHCSKSSASRGSHCMDPSTQHALTQDWTGPNPLP